MASLLIVLVEGLPYYSNTPTYSSSPRFRLTYFDAKGSAEISRILFKIGNIEFIDNRLAIHTSSADPADTSAYSYRKLNGDFAVNMDRLPVLEVDEDLVLGQSQSIERYIAAKCNLLGNNDEERAMIDCIAENVRDIKEKYATIRRNVHKSGHENNHESDKWFKEGGGLQEWLDKLEKSLPPTASVDSYSVGNKLSLADISIWHLLHDHFHHQLDVVRRLERSSKRCRLTHIAAKVAEESAVMTWVAGRPDTKF